MNTPVAVFLGRILTRLYTHKTRGRLTWRQFRRLSRYVITEFSE